MTATSASEVDERQAEKDRIVGLLGSEWSAIGGLLAGLDADAWSAPALPGWDVHDVVAHMVGTERSLDGAQFPQVPDGTEFGDHVRNDIGRANEAWILFLLDA